MSCRWDSAAVLLPGGYVDEQGVTHREAELSPLTGREEEWLAGDRRSGLAQRVTTLLSRCVSRIGSVGGVSEEVTRNLLVADRHYLLLKLRELTLGDQVRAHLCCPWSGCGKKVTVSFSVNDIPVTESVGQGPFHTMELSEAAAFMPEQGDTCRELGFRLPNGGDQEILAPIVADNEARAASLLLQRCIQNIGLFRHPNEAMVARLSPLARMEIERKMESIAPKVELTLESDCPECGRDYALPFDPAQFFFAELSLGRSRLHREVHYLAYHYHWSEQEIMSMPRSRRHTYIDVLAQEIESLNHAI